MRVLVRVDDINDFSEEINSLINNKIIPEIEELLNMTDKFDWVGPQRNAYEEKYKKTINELNIIPKMLEAYAKFLGIATTGYKEIKTKIDNEMEEIDDDIKKINSGMAEINEKIAEAKVEE